MKNNLVIIGGGLHAVTLAAGLQQKGFSDITIMDSRLRLGANWRNSTKNQGMADMRTPMFAHVDAWNPEGMVNFAREELAMLNADKMQIGTLDTFNSHLDHTIRTRRLEEIHVRTQATNLRRNGAGGYIVSTSNAGEVEAKYVVVAVGIGDPCFPDNVEKSDHLIHSHDVNVADSHWKGLRVCIIGGGLTSGTIALELTKNGSDVHICTRSQITVSQAEAEVTWIPEGPLHVGYVGIANPTLRMRMLRNSRIGRSLSPAIWNQLWKAVELGDIILHEKNETAENVIADPTWAKKHGIDVTIYATGFSSGISKLTFMEEIQRVRAIERTTSDLPVLDEHFQSTSHPGIFFMGRLGEYQGGPLSRNLPGAMYATRMIAGYIIG